jgi:hypothetical protein
MKASQLTIREISKVLFDTDKKTVYKNTVMNNKESQDYFYAKDDQDEILSVIENDTHLLIS